MSVNNFIPELWTGRIFSKLKKSLVFGDVVNRDYEGEIAQAGDTVHINSVGPVTIGSYTKNVTQISPETLNDAQMSLVITQSDYFCFEVDDIDQRQAKGSLLPAGMDQAAYGLRDTADQFIAALHVDASVVSASTPINSLNAYAALLSLSQALDEANVPAEGRWCIIPAWFKTKLVLAKVLVENTSNEAFDNGKVGRCAGFDLRASNNVANDGTDYYIMAGTNRAITFVDQINKVEAFRPESAFSDAVKGLHLYGAKVVDPDCLAVLDATEAAEP
ncbi:MAG: P22 coat protein - protein 5 domain protein [Armatimonadota bacterium]|nr:P22 coat protein - protein 5 domain protein [bacterium]